MEIKKITFLFLSFLFLGLTGCSDTDNSTYTQSELEAFLIRDCQEAIYIFKEKDLVYEFDFEKTSEGNWGEYRRYRLAGRGDEYYEFIWEVEPDGDGGIVTLAFVDSEDRISVRMGLMEQHNVTYIEGPNGGIIQNGSKMLWKLDFNFKDDPFYGK